MSSYTPEGFRREFMSNSVFGSAMTGGAVCEPGLDEKVFIGETPTVGRYMAYPITVTDEELKSNEPTVPWHNPAPASAQTIGQLIHKLRDNKPSTLFQLMRENYFAFVVVNAKSLHCFSFLYMIAPAFLWRLLYLRYKSTTDDFHRLWNLDVDTPLRRVTTGNAFQERSESLHFWEDYVLLANHDLQTLLNGILNYNPATPTVGCNLVEILSSQPVEGGAYLDPTVATLVLNKVGWTKDYNRSLFKCPSDNSLPKVKDYLPSFSDEESNFTTDQLAAFRKLVLSANKYSMSKQIQRLYECHDSSIIKKELKLDPREMEGMSASELEKVQKAAFDNSQEASEKAMYYLTTDRPDSGRAFMSLYPGWARGSSYFPWMFGRGQLGGALPLEYLADVWSTLLTIAIRRLEHRNKKLSENSRVSIENKIAEFRRIESEIQRIYDTLTTYNEKASDNKPEEIVYDDLQKEAGNLTTVSNKMKVRMHSILKTLLETLQS